ncbi:alpha/beta fold hydrolase [Capillimicrobium parvum]|uniref:Aminoacrylate hydrolase RutD n=1 Tax=Capillimicrobium parvum TaxID=2884022 RepID=A0A9E6XZ81_9ACTN|nr:alpha/beta hydrolase [Capillimicrobium parvum]UGS37262.1 Putative aminoacrylate hydrolase RutD [Capillimicrobium parvum]
MDVAYRRQGAGEPILHLHGVGMTRRWLPFHEALSQYGDLVAPEHPGFGDTPLPDWLEGFDDLVLHYAELADLLDLGPLHLVGHSFGGWIAAEIAAFYPERLRSLTLIAPLGLRVPGHTPTDIFRMSRERYLDLCLNGRADAYADQFDEGDETLFQSYAELTAFAKVAWNPRYDHKLDRRLGRVRCPAQVIAAQEDRILPRAHADRYAEILGVAAVATVAGKDGPTGHGLIAQEAERTAEQVATLIGGR